MTTRLIASTLLLVCAVTAQSAQIDLKFTGQLRTRAEFDKRNFDFGKANQSYLLLRTRVGLEATVDTNTHAFIQLQDSRTAGGTINGTATSGLTNDGKNVDIHQAYLLIDRIWTNGPSLKVGRFEMNFGNQRLFGAVDWHNVGRSWEGALFSQTTSKLKFSAFWLKRLEMNNTSSNRDFDLFGAYGTLPRANIDLFAVYELDSDTSEMNDDINRLDRITFGSYFKRSFGSSDFELNGAIQTGKIGVFGGDTIEQDISAFLITAELGHTFSAASKPRLAIGLDYASGDEDLVDSTFKSFDNLYYTGHKFRGYMDYFLSSSRSGLLDLVARASVKPIVGLDIALDAHYFQSAADYRDIHGELTTDVGTELDLSLTSSRIKGSLLAAGLSLFLPSESFAAANDPDPGLWGYTTLTVNF